MPSMIFASETNGGGRPSSGSRETLPPASFPFRRSASRIFACAALTCATARDVFAASSASSASTSASAAFSASAWNLFLSMRNVAFARLA